MTNSQNKAVGFLWLIFFAVFLALLVQDRTGAPLSKSVPLDLTKKAEPKGAGLRVLLPKRYRDELSSSRLVVLEDGIPLPIRAVSVRDVAEKGSGRYRARLNNLYFSASDNSSPLTNGRRYEILVPEQVRPAVKWGVLAFLTLSGFILLRARRAADDPPSEQKPLSPTLLASEIAVVAIAVGFYHLVADAAITTEFMLIKGKPFSDASGWLELGRSLKGGDGFVGGFSAHRPFYPLFLGSVFTFLGESLTVAKLTNIALLAVASSFAFLFGAFTFSRLVGLALAGWILFNPDTTLFVHHTLTEGLGFALSAAAVYILAAGFQTGRRSCFLVGGLLFAMSNLTRPFSLLAALFFGVCFLVLWIRKDGWPMKKILHNGLLFSAGILIVMFPWCLRQKIVNGTWSPSINSSILLYAGAAPEMGHTHTLNEAHFAEAEALGLEAHKPAWNEFYEKRFHDTVAEDPGRYVRRVASHTLAFFDEFRLSIPWRQAGLLIAVCILIICQAFRYRSALLLLLLPPAVALIPPLTELPTILLILASSAILLFSPLNRNHRAGAGIALSMLLGASLLNGMIANFALDRSAFIASWLVFYLVIAALAHLIQLPFLWERTKEIRADDGSAELSPWNRYAVVTLSVYFTIVSAGLATMGIRTALSSPRGEDPSTRPPSGLLDEDRAEHPELAGREFTEQIITLGEYQVPLRSNEDTGHLSSIFAPRPYARVVIYPRVRHGSRTLPWHPVHFAGTPDLLPDEDAFYILVAFESQSTDDYGNIVEMYEAISLTPYDLESGTIDRSKKVTFPVPQTRQ